MNKIKKVCPKCSMSGRVYTKKNGNYKCYNCGYEGKDFQIIKISYKEREVK